MSSTHLFLWGQLQFKTKRQNKTHVSENPQPRSCSGQLVLSAACCAFPQGGLFVSCVCSSIPSPETLITCDCWADTHTKKKETANQTAVSIIGRPRHNRAHSSICMIWLKKEIYTVQVNHCLLGVNGKQMIFNLQKKKRLRQCKHLILKTTTAALSLCRTKTRFSSSLMVSASFIFKRENTRLRTWGTVCAVRERDDSEREQEWDSRRMSGSACSPWSSRASSLAAAVTLQLQVDSIPLKGKTLIREQWGETGKAWRLFLFSFSLCPFSLWCSRSATILLPHTTCRLQRKRLAAEKENAAATPACICGIDGVRQVSEKTWEARKKWCLLNQVSHR